MLWHFPGAHLSFDCFSIWYTFLRFCWKYRVFPCIELDMLATLATTTKHLQTRLKPQVWAFWNQKHDVKKISSDCPFPPVRTRSKDWLQSYCLIHCREQLRLQQINTLILINNVLNCFGIGMTIMGQSPGVYMQKMACLSWVEIRLFHLKQVVSSKWCKRRLAGKMNLQLLISKIPPPYNVHLLTKKLPGKVMFLRNSNKSHPALYPFLQDKQSDNMLWGLLFPLNRTLCKIFSQSCWSSKSADSLWKKVYSANKSKDAPQEAPSASMDRLNFVETCRKVAWTVFHSPSACSKSCLQGENKKRTRQTISCENVGWSPLSLSEWI